MNPYMIDLVLKEKREEMLRVAERLRINAEYEAGQRSNKGRIGMALGELLIRAGQWLKSRYESEIELQAG